MKALLAFVFIPLLTVSAQEFSFKHPTCKAYYVESPDHFQKFSKLALEKMKERKFDLTILKKNIRLSKGDLYFSILESRPSKGLYKDCTVDVSLRESKGNHMGKKDKALYGKIVKRKYPRVTRKGKERCLRALKDAFVHIPTCTKP